MLLSTCVTCHLAYNLWSRTSDMTPLSSHKEIKIHNLFRWCKGEENWMLMKTSSCYHTSKSRIRILLSWAPGENFSLCLHEKKQIMEELVPRGLRWDSSILWLAFFRTHAQFPEEHTSPTKNWGQVVSLKSRWYHSVENISIGSTLHC